MIKTAKITSSHLKNLTTTSLSLTHLRYLSLVRPGIEWRLSSTTQSFNFLPKNTSFILSSFSRREFSVTNQGNETAIKEFKKDLKRAIPEKEELIEKI